MSVQVVKDKAVSYDESSPTFLRWNINSFSGKNKLQVAKGSPSGSLNRGTRVPYYITQYKNVKILNHRIIWTLFYGEIKEGFVVDHIDGNRLNNNIINLREISKRHNSHNQSIRPVNNTGVTGVSFKYQDGRTGVVAHWRTLAGQGSKYFSTFVYGLLPAFKMAVDYRENKIKELNKQGAAYTERHGI
jgi:hypothetical protein